MLSCRLLRGGRPAKAAPRLPTPRLPAPRLAALRLAAQHLPAQHLPVPLARGRAGTFHAAARGLAAVSARPTILAVATMDTKADEIMFVASILKSQGCDVKVVDVSCADGAKRAPEATVGHDVVASFHAEGAEHVLNILDRGKAVSAMSSAFEAFVTQEIAVESFDGIIGIGGSSGTALISPALQALPVGFPKVIVTTMASGDISSYVGCSDVTIMPAVVDIAGLNSISRAVLSNAATAVAAMSQMKKSSQPSLRLSKTIAITMFGVTTPCCDAVRAAFASDFEVITFHATGSGGRAMEKLLMSNMFSGVLDLTTTEIADEIVGGVLTAGPNRLNALVESMLPAVVSVGALDMVNFGARDSVPERFSQRKLHSHNAQVTLMRTTADELRQVARFMTRKLNQARGPLTLLLPERGLSMLDRKGMPFDDPEAREALFDELESTFQPTATRTIKRIDANINDPLFSNAVVQEFQHLFKLVHGGTVEDLPERVRSTSILSPLYEKPMDKLPPAGPGPRDAVLESLKEIVSSGKPIIGAGAGTGISAKFEEQGGADLIIIYNSGRFRMAGHGSLAGLLPFKDANAVMLEMGEEILPVLKRTPLLAGVCATDPFRSMEALLERVKDMGFAGVQNFPTVGLIDGKFRQNLEETGMSYQKEVNMVKTARRMGLLTTPYCFNEDEARQMASAGADIVVAHMGLTTSGSIGASTALTLDESVDLVQRIANAAREINPEILVLSHGGPISMPEDAHYVQCRVNGLHGFYGASSMERLPVEVAITEQIRRFKNIGDVQKPP